MKGIPVGQALDIEIPPPRPKRKPSIPYPRKTGAGASASQAKAKDGGILNAVSPSCCQNGLDLEREPLLEVVHFLFHFASDLLVFLVCLCFLFISLQFFQYYFASDSGSFCCGKVSNH